VPDLADSAERRGEAARWLHDLYPGLPADDRGGRQWLGTMHPGRMAEHLVVGELAAQPALIQALFTGLDEPRARRALTVLGRAALGYSAAVPLLARALAADLEHLAVPALGVAVQTNPVLDRLIADAVAAQPIAGPALERIAAAIPRRSLALANTAATVLRRLGSLEYSQDSQADRRAAPVTDL
jgi:hypothetical protein